MSPIREPTHPPRDDLYDRLIAQWESEGAHAGTGTSLSELESFERANRIRFGPQIREYFLAVNGMLEDSLDDSMIEFLPLERVQRLPEHVSDWTAVEVKPIPGWEQYYVFADYLMSSHLYAIRLGRDGDTDVIAYCGSKHSSIALSWIEFLRLYLTDRQQVFPLSWVENSL